MKFLAQTRVDIVAVPAKAAQFNHNTVNAGNKAAVPTATAVPDAQIQAIVANCLYRGILSNLLPNLNNQFSRSLLLVWYAHLPPVNKSNLICKFVIDAFVKACSCLINFSIFLSKASSSSHSVFHKIFNSSSLNLGSFLYLLKSSSILLRIAPKWDVLSWSSGFR